MGWPYRWSELIILDERCSCGAPRATVDLRNGKTTLTYCSLVLTGLAEGGPNAHMFIPAESPIRSLILNPITDIIG